MAGLAMGGVAVGVFHLITHAFFKALLFLGAGSVIHGCHQEQDIRKMGGLRADMPVTFITYAVGMVALAGLIPFAGFWSKDGILEAGFDWRVARGPFFLLVFGALLTAFYMTRQVCYVFFGHWRGKKPAHESPAVMTVPLAILAFFAAVLGFIGTPAWPWFRAFLDGGATHLELSALIEPKLIGLMSASTAMVLLGISLGLKLYSSSAPKPEEPDVLESRLPLIWRVLRDRFYVDELYAATLIAFYAWWARVSDWLDRQVWGGLVRLVAWSFRQCAELNRLADNHWINGGFDKGCEELALGGGLLARVQSGRAQLYLRLLAVAVVVLAAILIWSSRA
jgi:NADH-quinone oxidoreductase subunit L